MICAIHQPNFFPWAGYFYKIYAADHFVFLNDVQYSKQSYTKRVKLKDAALNRTFYAQGSIFKPHLGTSIQEVLLKEKGTKEQIETQLDNNYNGYPYYSETMDLLDRIFYGEKSYKTLSELNISTVKSICAHLNIHTPLHLSSEMKVNSKGTKRITEIIQELHCDTYLSGPGIKKYIDSVSFSATSIDLITHDFFTYQKRNPYPQIGDSFIPGLSILDLLFNIGKKQTFTHIQAYSA